MKRAHQLKNECRGPVEIWKVDHKTETLKLIETLIP